ncbi:hypothetical protein GA0115259_100411, partial [Streptomyces sp. MnatMP-M17]
GRGSRADLAGIVADAWAFARRGETEAIHE